MNQLYVVATPIGNLSDITLRALEVLKSVDYIACEDTRVSLKLLSFYNIKKDLISYHQHSNKSKIEKIIKLILSGKKIAMISDAGTPGLSDPGSKLLRAAYDNSIKVVPIPGPSTLSAILSVADFNIHEFVFLGFMPHKKGRQTKLKEIAQEQRAIVIFESVYRIKKLLGELLDFLGDRQIIIGRELTKKFETIYHGKISEILPILIEKGEFVIIIEPVK